VGNAHLLFQLRVHSQLKNDGLEPQRRDVEGGPFSAVAPDAIPTPPYRSGGYAASCGGMRRCSAHCGVKRGNLYAEQGRIGDERRSCALKISGKLLEFRR
jgi:hypothetical protein